jgi:transposase
MADSKRWNTDMNDQGSAGAFRQDLTLSEFCLWTPAFRAQPAGDHRSYPTCLTDAERALVAPALPQPARAGRPRHWPMRLVVDAILYGLRTGTAWRHLPCEFPPSASVYRWSLHLARIGAFERFCHRLVMVDRERVGRKASTQVAIIDAQAAHSDGVGVAGIS